jgi:predicted aspartyl protease
LVSLRFYLLNYKVICQEPTLLYKTCFLQTGSRNGRLTDFDSLRSEDTGKTNLIPAEVTSDLKFEIGYVLLIDIVGYSKLLINEQRERLQTLNEIVRSTAQFRESDERGMLFGLPTGDGMALIFRDSLEAPVRCALEISAALKNHPAIQVRMGINSGPVSEVADVNERANIAGAGINMAQRVMDCGDAGHILLSKRVADDLGQYRHWQPHLHELGECEVKHSVMISVVNLYTDKLGNSEVPKKFKKLTEQKQATAVPRPATDARSKRAHWGLIAAVSLLIAALLAGVLLFFQPNRLHRAQRYCGSSALSAGSARAPKEKHCGASI